MGVGVVGLRDGVAEWNKETVRRFRLRNDDDKFYVDRWLR